MVVGLSSMDLFRGGEWVETMVPNEYGRKALRTLIGGGTAGVAFQAGSGSFSTLTEFAVAVTEISLILFVSSVTLLISEEYIFPTEEMEETDQPSDLPLFLR